MNAPAKLGLYGLLLAAVLVGSVVVGGAVGPVGLSNAEPAAAHDGMAPTVQGAPGLAAAADGLQLRLAADTLPVSQPATVSFTVADHAGPVTRFDIEHTKRMFLVVVRRDLTGFQHLHPTMASDGTWSAPLTLRESGVYRVYADFAVDGEKHTLGTDLFVGGDFTPEPLPAAAPTAAAGDGYSVELDGAARVGEEARLVFTVHRHGEVVDRIPPYLGARGHLVALRAGDLAYLDVDADEDRLAFDAEFPTAGDYRLFLQFRADGQVRTAAFTLEAQGGSR